MTKETLRRRRIALIAGFGALALTAAALPAVATTATGIDAFGGAFRNSANKGGQVAAAIQNRPAKNVILLIGDGMGDSEITVARDYAYGAAGTLPGIDALPLTGQYTTYSLYKDGTPFAGKPDYVPDSAATGTAWATGFKSYDNAIGVDIHGTAHDNIIEIARANGLRTGNVTTSEIQDATPAVLEAHVAARSCYAPDTAACGTDLLQNGGKGSISEQLLDTRADVTFGGGTTSFDKSAVAGPWAGQTLFDQATTRGFQVVKTAAQLDAVRRTTDGPVLGLFAPGNFPTRYLATPATVGGADLAPVTCSPNPARLDTRLSLASLTNKSIDLLNKGNGKGFFLQVEGASIDKQDHAADACGQIGETIDFDEAVQAALAFAKKDGNTLVIATADHAHSSQIVDSTPPGLSIALLTKDGAPLKISYGTSAAGGSQQHTGAQLRIAAYGPGAAKVVGLTDQTDNFATITGSLQLNRDLAGFSSRAFATVRNSPKAGNDVNVQVSGFGGDRQLTGTIGGTSVTISKTDLIDGSASFSFEAPAKGNYVLSLIGSQTGKTVKVPFATR